MTEKRNTRPPATPEWRKSAHIGGESTTRRGAVGECDVVREIDVRIARLAARQCGVVSRRQLLALGLSARAIDQRIAAGKLHPVHRGVYLVGHAVPPFGAREMGAVLACGDRAAVSHRTAGELFEWIEPSGGPVHISLPSGSRRDRDGIHVHRPTTLAPEDVGLFDFLWRDERLVVEADSVAYHSLRTNVEKDRRRDAELRAQDHEVLRFTWTQITHQPEAVIAGVAVALARRTAAPRR